jgi:hypothetical protein
MPATVDRHPGHLNAHAIRAPGRDAPLWHGQSGAIGATDTTDVITVTGALATDLAFISAANASAGAAIGSAGGVSAVVTDDTITLTFPSAAGTEVYNVMLMPALSSVV